MRSNAHCRKKLHYSNTWQGSKLTVSTQDKAWISLQIAPDLFPAHQHGQGPGQGITESILMPSYTSRGTTSPLSAALVTPPSKDTAKQGRTARVSMCPPRKIPYEMTKKLGWLQDSWIWHPRRRVTISWSAHLDAESHTSCRKATNLILILWAVVSPYYCSIKVCPHLITFSTKKLYSLLCNLRSQPLHLLMHLSAMLNSLAGPDFFLCKYWKHQSFASQSSFW